MIHASTLRAGESVVEALRRDFHEALDEGDWRYGITSGMEDFSRMVFESPSLQARMREMSDQRRDHLAQVLVEETDADSDDPTPRFVAAQVVALTHAISLESLRRRRAGESHAAVLPAVRAAVDQGFDLLKSGIGDYPR
ncbi:hypothetical protein GCM10023195_08390 [Actinoallomurus liliacearum]|uniref:MftR C-terminal domain-containing protein n=1 Tax=Actinoallomurus liliacearum TaxID=1080073 RepID=A0ABP8TAL0_9ACTN